MATKSILKDISIRKKQSSQAFIKALENSHKMDVKKEVTYQRKLTEISREQIKNLFGEDK